MKIFFNDKREIDAKIFKIKIYRLFKILYNQIRYIVILFVINMILIWKNTIIDSIVYIAFFMILG